MLSNDNQQRFGVPCEKKTLLEEKKINAKGRIFLYFSILLMVSAFVIIFLDNVDFFIHGIRADEEGFIAWALISIGIIINFICVPVLYWSSFHKFIKNDDFWDSESFWILPLFFFGSFFQYVSNLPYVMVILPFSLVLIFVVHIWVMFLSRNLIVMNEQFENTSEYFRSFTYLTAYYFILITAIIFFDLFQKFKYWIE